MMKIISISLKTFQKKLSDLYEIPEDEKDLELRVLVININRGNNDRLLNACKTLKDYAEYIYRIREYAKESPIEEAVERVITECIREGILKEFLEQNRAEAKTMSIYEYNEEEHIRMEREDAYADGHKVGFMSGHKSGFKDGSQDGQSRMIKLIRIMTEEGMLESIPRLSEDEDFVEEMLLKFKLKERDTNE